MTIRAVVVNFGAARAEKRMKHIQLILICHFLQAGHERAHQIRQRTTRLPQALPTFAPRTQKKFAQVLVATKRIYETNATCQPKKRISTTRQDSDRDAPPKHGRLTTQCLYVYGCLKSGVTA
jgi:hypothetical protein